MDEGRCIKETQGRCVLTRDQELPGMVKKLVIGTMCLTVILGGNSVDEAPAHGIDDGNENIQYVPIDEVDDRLPELLNNIRVHMGDALNRSIDPVEASMAVHNGSPQSVSAEIKAAGIYRSREADVALSQFVVAGLVDVVNGKCGRVGVSSTSVVMHEFGHTATPGTAADQFAMYAQQYESEDPENRLGIASAMAKLKSEHERNQAINEGFNELNVRNALPHVVQRIATKYCGGNFAREVLYSDGSYPSLVSRARVLTRAITWMGMHQSKMSQSQLRQICNMNSPLNRRIAREFHFDTSDYRERESIVGQATKYVQTSKNQCRQHERQERQRQEAIEKKKIKAYNKQVRARAKKGAAGRVAKARSNK